MVAYKQHYIIKILHMKLYISICLKRYKNVTIVYKWLILLAIILFAYYAYTRITKRWPLLWLKFYGYFKLKDLFKVGSFKSFKFRKRFKKYILILKLNTSGKK